MPNAIAIENTLKIEIDAANASQYQDVLTNEALEFISKLHHLFDGRRKDLLEKREQRQAEIDAGQLPSFIKETAHIRNAEWTVDPTPPDLLDRRVEITGPVDRKMIINALNSGAKIFMADFEDSNTPSWDNNMQGQQNLRDAINRTITYEHLTKRKLYTLNEEIATLMVRPRGWHLEEKHLTIDGQPMSGALVDFGLYFFHNAKNLIATGSGPYFYLPKLESHLEARLWNDVFVFAQDYLGIRQGTIKATVLIETILASFEMNEILYELRKHSAGLNCGRWDYIFSFIKKFRNLEGFVLPDRARVTMEVHFMKSYSLLLIQTCHRRGVHAMGGMAAQIPIKNDAEANKVAMKTVAAGKIREVANGHDGTWVAHPGMVASVMEIFNEYMPTANQINNKRLDVKITPKDLLAVPSGDVTEAGLRENINVGILYIESWLRGNGAAAIYNKMEDAATAEISRTQVWQWLHAATVLEDGRTVDQTLVMTLLEEELQKIKAYVGDDRYASGKFDVAIPLFKQLILEETYSSFLTLPAYALLG